MMCDLGFAMKPVCWALRCGKTRFGGAREKAPMASNFVFFIEWKAVASGPGRAACCVELMGKKKVMGAVEDYLEQCADIKVDIDASERLI